MVTTNETDVNYVSWTIGLEIAKLTRYVKQTNKQKIERQQDSSFFFSTPENFPSNLISLINNIKNIFFN